MIPDVSPLGSSTDERVSQWCIGVGMNQPHSSGDRPSNERRAVLRVAPGTTPPAESAKVGSEGGGLVAPCSRALTEHLKLARRGGVIVTSLVEDEARSVVSIPKGTTDMEALLALNAVSLSRRGIEIFPPESLQRLSDWAAERRPPSCHGRTYSVVLFVEKTKMKDAWEADRILDRMRVEPGVKLIAADPVEAAIVLAAHVLRRNGETRARDLCIRTASCEIALNYVDSWKKIFIEKRDPEARHEGIVTAGTLRAAPTEPGWIVFAKSLLGMGRAS